MTATAATAAFTLTLLTSALLCCATVHIDDIAINAVSDTGRASSKTTGFETSQSTTTTTTTTTSSSSSSLPSSYSSSSSSSTSSSNNSTSSSSSSSSTIVLSDYVEIVFGKQEITVKEIRDTIRKYTDADFEIVGFEETDDGCTRVIVKFEDVKSAKHFESRVVTQTDNETEDGIKWAMVITANNISYVHSDKIIGWYNAILSVVAVLLCSYVAVFRP